MATIVSKFSGIGVGLLFLAACSRPATEPVAAAPLPTAEPAAATAATPVISINEVMVAVIDHAAHNLWNVERTRKAPTTDADWAVIHEHAAQIAAAGPAITVGGTGPSDAVWIKAPTWHVHADHMSAAGKAAMDAAQARNFDALVKANGQLVESCEGCHKEFKPTVPTEGIVHTHTD
jgi:hypothetical protein